MNSLQNNPKVSIILPTYNGAHFLTNQLSSIDKQTYKNIEIFIRDDGSNDNTLNIIDQFIKDENFSSKITLLNDKKGNLGCPKSFYEILKKCPKSDYYAFCDQDDIWYPNKIESALKNLEKLDRKQPSVYYSAFDYVKEDGDLIYTSAKQEKNPKIHNVLFYTPGLGFTIVFNNSAKEKFFDNVEPGIEMQDRWIIRCAVCFGSVFYENKPLAAHIRHEDAVTSGDSGSWKLLKDYLKNELFGSRMRIEKTVLIYFLTVFQNQLKEQDLKVLELFTRRNTLTTQIKKICFNKRLRPSLISEFMLRLNFIFWKL